MYSIFPLSESYTAHLYLVLFFMTTNALDDVYVLIVYAFTLIYLTPRIFILSII